MVRLIKMSVTFKYLGFDGADKRALYATYEGKKVKVGSEVTFQKDHFIKKARGNPNFDEVKGVGFKSTTKA